MSNVHELVKVQIIAGREFRGLSQTELARRSGIPQPNVNKFETGARKPSIETVAKIAKALDLRLSYFFEPGADPADYTIGKTSYTK